MTEKDNTMVETMKDLHNLLQYQSETFTQTKNSILGQVKGTRDIYLAVKNEEQLSKKKIVIYLSVSCHEYLIINL